MRRLLLLAPSVLCGCPTDPGFPAKECAIVAGQEESGLEAVGMIQRPGDDGWWHTCTATLVAPRVVVTAQHCFSPTTRPEDVSFVTGRRGERLEAAGVEVFYLGEFVQMFTEEGDEWWWIDTENDFAVMTLDHEPSVAPMPYRPDAVSSNEEGDVVTVVGYGTTALEAEDSGTKRSGQATLSWVGPDWLETERGAGQSSGCYGDSGGPLILDGQVVGVFSYFVDPDVAVCEGGGQYVRIDRFLSLIDQAIDATGGAVPADDDSCQYAGDGICDEGTACYVGTDATDCADGGQTVCACDDRCVDRGDCCQDCAAEGECEETFCVAGDGFCDQDLACCEFDPDCGTGAEEDPDIEPDDEDVDDEGVDARDEREQADPGECDPGICRDDDGYCDEDRACCAKDSDCAVDC